LVLLVACLNIAGLQVARAVGRRQEMAVRSALGAGRRRLLRQALVETGVLAIAGAAVGLLLAAWGVGILLALGPANLPLVGSVGLDARVLAVALVATVLAAIVSGTVPALVLGRPSVTALASNAVGRTVSDGNAGRVRRILVVWQVALAFVLLTGSGLLVKSFARLHAVRPGFTAAHVLTFRVNLPGGSIGGPRERAEFMQRAVAEFEALPGVEAVGFVGGLPLAGAIWSQPYGLDHRDPSQWGADRADLRVVSSAYFRAMGTRLLAGRGFTPREDVVEEERVAIVDAALAHRVVPGGGLDAAVGKTIGFPLDGQATWARIVGVVENVRQEDLRRQVRPTIYVPYRQEASRAVAVAVRASGDPQDLAAVIRRRIRALSGEEPVVVFGFRGLQEYVQEALAPSRFALTVVSVLAGIALVLALIGLYGVQAYAVGRRVREIGVRMAMGARPSQILQGELGTGLRLVAAGLALGLGLSYWSVRALGGLLYDIPPTDPVTYLVIALLMGVATGIACYVPARRAALVHPMEALRDE